MHPGNSSDPLPDGLPPFASWLLYRTNRPVFEEVQFLLYSQSSLSGEGQKQTTHPRTDARDPRSRYDDMLMCF